MSVRKELLFNDGEALDYNDLNNAQRYMRSALYDGVLAQLARVHESQDWAGTNNLGGPRFLSILGNGLAPTITGSSLVVSVASGECGQHTAGAIAGANTGDDVNMIWHGFDTSLAGTTYQFTSGAADATNPRWDILQAKIDHTTGGSETRDSSTTAGVLSSASFDKERQTRLTMSIKAGTAAASPTEPSADTGYVKVFAWRIEATATAITAANFRDYRMPVGMTIIDVPARLWPRTGGYTESSDGMLVADGASIRTAQASPWGKWRTGRLVAVGLTSDTVAGSTATALLTTTNYAVNPYTNTTLLDCSSALLDNTAAFAFRGRILTDQAIWMDGTNCPSVQGAADFAVYGSPTVKTSLLRLDLRLASGATHADTFGMARFYVAGM